MDRCRLGVIRMNARGLLYKRILTAHMSVSPTLVGPLIVTQKLTISRYVCGSCLLILCSEVDGLRAGTDGEYIHPVAK